MELALTIVIGVLSSIVGVEYARWRSRRERIKSTGHTYVRTRTPNSSTLATVGMWTALATGFASGAYVGTLLMKGEPHGVAWWIFVIVFGYFGYAAVGIVSAIITVTVEERAKRKAKQPSPIRPKMR